MRIAFLTVFVLSVYYASANDSTGIVHGKVFDLHTLEPLPAANVIYGRNKGGITDLQGLYIIKTAPGNLIITFQFVGYKSVTRQLSVNASDSISLNIGMEHEITEIDQIVISAGKVEQKVSDITVSMSLIKPESFSSSHITDAEEVINKSSGIEVMDGQASVRGGSGFSYGAGSRVLALIDGLPMLSADAGNIKWQFLPLESLNQIEIIKGASSVLYGSSAINGIINFRTADAGTTPLTQFYVESGVFDKPRNKNWVWWDSPRLFSSASFSHLQKKRNTDIGISTGFLTDNGYRKWNDEKLGRMSLKLKHQNQKITGLTYGINIQGGMTKKRDFILWEDAEYGALKQAASTAQKLYGSFLAIDPFVSLKNNGRFSHDLRARLQSTTNEFPNNAQNNSNALSVFTEYQLWYRFSKYIALNAGISDYLSRIESPFYGNHQGVNFSGFTQFDIQPTERIKMVAGLRMEYNSLDGVRDKLVPLFRTGINYKLLNYTFLRASYGQGYRYPSIAEKHASTTLGSVRIYPNPSIQAESGWSSEIGLKQGVLTRFLTGQADIAIFYSQNSDMIEYLFALHEDDETGIAGLGFKSENLEQSRVYGYELEFLLHNTFGNFQNTIHGGYVFMYPVEYNRYTNQNTDVFLKYRRKHSGKLNLSSRLNKAEIGLSLFAKSGILNIDHVFLSELTREEILPGFYDYWTTNVSGYFLMDGSFAYHLNDNYKLSLAIKNLSNTEYIGRPGDIRPHRNLSLRFTGRF